jgi:hypothetical protein
MAAARITLTISVSFDVVPGLLPCALARTAKHVNATAAALAIEMRTVPPIDDLVT